MKSIVVPGTEGGRMRYHDLPGDGPPLIVVHGLGCASSCDYPTVAADPALCGRRMLLVDLLGSGFSDRPAEFGYTVSDHAGCIVALVEQLDLSPVDVFGHSMGGAIAITAATRLSGRLRRLVVGEPNLEPGGGAFSRDLAAIAEDDHFVEHHRAIAEAARAAGNDIWAASMLGTAPRAILREAASLVAGRDPSWRSMLLGLSEPRTLVVGERSLPYMDADGLSEAGIRVEIVAGAGHSMAWDNPAGLARAIAIALS